MTSVYSPVPQHRQLVGLDTRRSCGRLWTPKADASAERAMGDAKMTETIADHAPAARRSACWE